MFAKKKVGIILGILGFFSWIFVLYLIAQSNPFIWLFMTNGGFLGYFGSLLIPLLFILCIIFAGIGKGKLMAVIPPIILAACVYNIYCIYPYIVTVTLFEDSFRFLYALVSRTDNFAITEVLHTNVFIGIGVQFIPVAIVAVLYFVHAFKRVKQAGIPI